MSEPETIGTDRRGSLADLLQDFEGDRRDAERRALDALAGTASAMAEPMDDPMVPSRPAAAAPVAPASSAAAAPARLLSADLV